MRCGICSQQPSGRAVPLQSPQDTPAGPSSDCSLLVLELDGAATATKAIAQAAGTGGAPMLGVPAWAV